MFKGSKFFLENDSRKLSIELWYMKSVQIPIFTIFVSFSINFH